MGHPHPDESEIDLRARRGSFKHSSVSKMRYTREYRVGSRQEGQLANTDQYDGGFEKRFNMGKRVSEGPLARSNRPKTESVSRIARRRRSYSGILLANVTFWQGGMVKDSHSHVKTTLGRMDREVKHY